MKESFERLVKEEVAPFLKERGYRKSALTFTRKNVQLQYLINLQKSHGNTGDRVEFYVNVAIFSPRLSEVIGEPGKAFTQAHEGHVYKRIRECVPEAPDSYSVTPGTRPEELSSRLLKDLGALDAYFQRVATVDAMVDEMIRGNGLFLHEELFQYLLETGNLPKARLLARGLCESFGQDSRWKHFREAMEARLLDKGLGGSLDAFVG